MHGKADRAAKDGLEGAERASRAILEQCCDEPEVLREHAQLLSRRHDLPGALSLLRRAVTIQPFHAVTWCMLGVTLGFMGEHGESGRALKRALELAPDMPAGRWAHAFWLLADGQWDTGWAEYRWGVVHRHRPLRTLRPPWDGRPLQGGTLFVWAEQGQGDTLMFSRFLAAAKTRVERLVFEVQEPLFGLFHNHPSCDLVVTQQADGSIPGRWSEHISLMDLPGVLGVDHPDRLAEHPPWLPAPQGVTRVPGEGLNVGLCWRGGPDHPMDFARSLPPKMVRPLLDVRGVTLVSLVPGDQPPMGIPPMPKASTWQETQSIVAGLDLVVTVDTAIAHLAASMRCPTWILLAHPSDFRWLLDREDTPWYPTARLFRQRVRGEWEPVIRRVLESLAQWTRCRPQPDKTGGEGVTLEVLGRCASEMFEVPRATNSCEKSCIKQPSLEIDEVPRK